MARVNIGDRDSLERVYPEDAFAEDAAQNDKVPTEVLHGVRIGSAPDADGWFVMERAARHVGEPETHYFLAPFRRVEELVEHGPSRAPRRTSRPRPRQGYDRFLDDLCEAAERFGFRQEESPAGARCGCVAFAADDGLSARP